jgi:hypothetical protein
MNKNEMKKIALLGLTTGFIISSQLHALDAAKDSKPISAVPADWDPNDGNAGYYLMTEDELLLELNDEGAKLYHSLDKQGKELAREVASQRCNMTNSCKGLNACQTDKNECAGKGDCKGKGKCAFADKNVAVKVVADKIKMEQKRSDLSK